MRELIMFAMGVLCGMLIMTPPILRSALTIMRLTPGEPA